MKQKSIIIIILVAIIICIGIMFRTKFQNSNAENLSKSENATSEEKSNSEKCEYLVDISRKGLDTKINNNESFWVYVGRPSCPDCEVFYPELEEILNKQQKNIFYYDTTCKASQKKDMSVYVQSLNIQEIPAILKVENGEITVLDMQTDSDKEQFEEEF